MDAKKFLELQGQIKQNNHEYLEFVSELDSWKTDLDKKQPQADKPSPPQELPPVRNSLLKKKMKKKAKSQLAVAEPEQRLQEKKKIRAYDYKAWDKFDVDKACEEVDNAAPKSESEYETDEEWEEERRKQIAEAKKLAGNEAFKSQRFDEAVELYTKAVQLNPDDAVYYCNRAMALLRLDRHAAAEADCSAALGLDSRMVKAFYRRGQARQKLGKLPEALRDLEEALAMEPGNRTLQTEVGELRLRLHPETYATGEVKPIFDKPADKRSAKPLVRVPVQEVSAAAIAAAAASAAAVNGHRGGRSGDTPTAAAPAAAAERQSRQDGGVAQNPGVAAAAAASAPAHAPPPPPPETPFQYKAAHRSLARRDPLAFCTGVLCAVEPERLPTLLGESLESDGLLDLVAAFSAGLAAHPELAGRVLRCLRLLADRVKRFATCVAFLGASERARVAELVLRLRDLLGEPASADVALLASAYGVGDRLAA